MIFSMNQSHSWVLYMVINVLVKQIVHDLIEIMSRVEMDISYPLINISFKRGGRQLTSQTAPRCIDTTVSYTKLTHLMVYPKLMYY